MSQAGPPKLTDDEWKEICKIPDGKDVNVVLQNLLFNLGLKGILTPDNVENIIGK